MASVEVPGGRRCVRRALKEPRMGYVYQLDLSDLQVLDGPALRHDTVYYTTHRLKR